MSETKKVLLVFVVMVSLAGGLFTWFAEMDPGPSLWLWRAIWSLGTVLPVGLIIKAHFRKDIAPDFLKPLGARVLEKGGLCFAVIPALHEGVLYMNVWFQNRYDQPCSGFVTMQPRKPLFLRGPNIPSLKVPVECPPSGFGVVLVPVAVPERHRGKRRHFRIGADSEYPSGRERMVRFRDGGAVGPTSGAPLAGVGLFILSPLGGLLHSKSEVYCRVRIPKGSSTDLPEGATQEAKVLWTEGDSSPMADPGGWWLERQNWV